MSGNGETPERYTAGITLVGGTHFAVVSEHGVPALMRVFANEDGGGSETWAMEPEEMGELGHRMVECAISAEAYRSNR